MQRTASSHNPKETMPVLEAAHVSPNERVDDGTRPVLKARLAPETKKAMKKSTAIIKVSADERHPLPEQPAEKGRAGETIEPEPRDKVKEQREILPEQREVVPEQQR